MDSSTNNMSEKLVQYLDGELFDAEKQRIEQHLASDEKLQYDFESLQETREAVKMYGLQQKVSGIHQQIMQEMKTPVRKINSTRRILRYSIAVAASVVLIVGSIIGYNFYNLSSGKVFAANYQSYELGSVRDTDTTKTSVVEVAYREKDFKKAIELLEQNNSIPVKETFLAAMSYVELANNTKAITAFKRVIAENDTTGTKLFKDEAEYYLALTYIRNRDYDFALDLLRGIQENPEHIYNKRVTGKLIRQVKMLKWR